MLKGQTRFQTLASPLFTMLLLALLLQNCSTAPAPAPEKELGPNASIIRSPVADPEADPAEAATLTFEETNYNFGSVTEGETVSHVYAFTNTGKVPLLITDARSTCGCTVPTYPEKPVAPGESGEIVVTFDTAGKEGRQSKPVTITANTYPAVTTVYITGQVEKKQ